MAKEDKYSVRDLKESTAVQDQIKKVFVSVLKEKIIWIVLGAFSIVALDLLKQLASKLIDKI